MINFKVGEKLDGQRISRYRLQKLTNWNYKRINAYYFGRVLEINVRELDELCKIFECNIEDLIEYCKD